MKNKMFSFLLLINSIILFVFTLIKSKGPISQLMNYVFVGICLIETCLAIYHVFVFGKIAKNSSAKYNKEE